MTANSRMQLTYPPRERTDRRAREHVKLVNRRADLRFTARTIETARSGGGPLEGWDAEYVDGRPWAAEARAARLRSAIEPTDSLGEVAFHVLPEAADLPVRYTVRLAGEQAGAMGELFEQTPVPGEDADSGAVTLTYTHYGLSLGERHAGPGRDRGPVHHPDADRGRALGARPQGRLHHRGDLRRRAPQRIPRGHRHLGPGR